MKPWFEDELTEADILKLEADIIKFPTPKEKVIQMPNVQSYPDFITGVQDLQAKQKDGTISQETYNKLYTDLIRKFMKKENNSPWFENELAEVQAVSNTDYKPLIDLLSKNGIRAGQPKLSRIDSIRHIRVGASAKDTVNNLQKLGASTKVMPAPNKLSSTYDQIAVVFPNNFNDQTLAGKEFYIASALKKGSSVGIKVFTPTNLDLAGKTMSRQELYKSLKNTIPSKVTDNNVQELLLQLLDVAIKKKTAVEPDIIEQFTTADLRQLGIDFGEILGPLMSGQDNIKFPAGNSMLADVEIDGKLISIKSASGSGTSFKAILPYLDKLKNNKAIKLNKEEKEVNKFFRAFVDTKGNNMDKIVAGSNLANTPEHQAMAKLIGKDNFNLSDIEAFAGKFGKRQYGKFLETIYPVSIAGGYKINDKARPNGLPQDAAYYMHKSDKKPSAKQAGKPFWMAKGPAVAGRNIMVYILAASFLKDAKRVEKKDKFSNFLKKVMQGTNAELMWVTINANGTLSLQRKAINNVNADFQYHAPSHIPGNNLPGISLKL
jgi:hypothetical protein